MESKPDTYTSTSILGSRSWPLSEIFKEEDFKTGDKITINSVIYRIIKKGE